jgi:hypothetical protein
MIGGTSYPEMLLQGDRRLHWDADKQNTSLQLGGVELPNMKMRGLPCKQISNANANI